MSSSQIVAYALEDGTLVRFEAPVTGDFVPAGADGHLAGEVRAAVAPAVEAAREVLARVAAAGPQEVQLKFGMKVTGGASWLIAKVSSEANFEVTLTWRRPEPTTEPAAAPQPGGGSMP